MDCIILRYFLSIPIVLSYHHKKVLHFINTYIFWDFHIIFHIIFMLYSINMTHQINWFLSVEPCLHSLHPRDKFYLVIVYDPFNMLLDLILWHFIEDFCIVIYQGYNSFCPLALGWAEGRGKELWYLLVQTIISVFTKWLNTKPIKALRLTNQIPVILAAPETLGYWTDRSTLSFPREKMRAMIFHLLLLFSAYGEDVWHLPIQTIFSSTQLDCAGPVRASGWVN